MVQLQFKAYRGNGVQGDIALDDIEIDCANVEYGTCQCDDGYDRSDDLVSMIKAASELRVLLIAGTLWSYPAHPCCRRAFRCFRQHLRAPCSWRTSTWWLTALVQHSVLQPRLLSSHWHV